MIFLAGRDPRDEVSGGHSAYVRSYSRAAQLAGFSPHLFCAAPASRVEACAYGTIHRVASPVRPFRQLAAGFHAPWLGRAVVRFAAAEGGDAPVLLHGFGVWSCAAAWAAPRLARRGVAAEVVVSSYTTYEEEARAGVRSAAAYGWRQRLAARAAHGWIRLAVERWERAGYLAGREVTVNYESVRRMIEAKYGAAAHCRRLPYTCESAFAAAPGPVLEGAEGAEGAGREAVPAVAGAEWAGREALPAAARLAVASELAAAAGPAAVAGLAAVAALVPREAPLLVTVARHQPRKGVDLLVRALARLRAAGVAVRACLVGGGPELAAHRQLIADLGLADSVVCTGVVESVAPFLALGEVFVLASREEQSGSLALIEALRQGLPVVASGVDGILEDVTDGEDALLVAPGDVAALAAALARLLGDGELRRHLAAGARATFAARFSPQVVAAALAELYARCGVTP